MRWLALVAILAAACPAAAFASESPIVQPTETVGGRTLPDWERLWSKWTFSFKYRTLANERECLPQAPGPVRFLAIPVGDEHVSQVTCTVSAGTYLMLGEPEIYCTDVDPDPDYPLTARGLQRCARRYWRELTDPHPRVVLDGQPIANGYVVHPRVFRFRMPAHDNVFGAPGVRIGRAAVVARATLIKPLAPGQHTLIKGVKYRDLYNIVGVFKLTVV
jgi:hypothetical protein